MAVMMTGNISPSACCRKTEYCKDPTTSPITKKLQRIFASEDGSRVKDRSASDAEGAGRWMRQSATAEAATLMPARTWHHDAGRSEGRIAAADASTSTSIISSAMPISRWAQTAASQQKRRTVPPADMRMSPKMERGSPVPCTARPIRQHEALAMARGTLASARPPRLPAMIKAQETREATATSTMVAGTLPCPRGRYQEISQGASNDWAARRAEIPATAIRRFLPSHRP